MITKIDEGTDGMFYPAYCKKSWFFKPWKRFQKVEVKQVGCLNILTKIVNFSTEKEAEEYLESGTVEELLKSI